MSSTVEWEGKYIRVLRDGFGIEARRDPDGILLVR